MSTSTREVGEYVLKIDTEKIRRWGDYNWSAKIREVMRQTRTGSPEVVQGAPVGFLHYGETEGEAADNAVAAFNAWRRDAPRSN